jgi:hypothetical protein
MAKTTLPSRADTVARPRSAPAFASEAAASCAVSGVPSEKTIPSRTAAE